MRAAEKAERREGIREADRYYARALDLVGDEQTEQTLELRLGRAGTLNTLGDLQSADELLAEVADGAARAGRLDLRAQGAHRQGATSRAKQGRGTDARAYVGGGRDDRRGVGRPIAPGSRHLQAAYVRWWFEEPARRRCEVCGAPRDRRGARRHARFRSRATIGSRSLLYNVGDLDGAEEQLVRVIGAVERIRQPPRPGAGDLPARDRQVPPRRGRGGRAARAPGARLARADGRQLLPAQNLRALALCALARAARARRGAAARRRFRSRSRSAARSLVDIYRILVDVLIGQDRLDDARELAVLRVPERPGGGSLRPRRGPPDRGEPANGGGPRDVAVESFTKALELLEQQGLPLDLGEARLAYGRALRGSATTPRRGASSAGPERTSTAWAPAGSSTRSTASSPESQRGPAWPAPSRQPELDRLSRQAAAGADPACSRSRRCCRSYPCRIPATSRLPA